MFNKYRTEIGRTVKALVKYYKVNKTFTNSPRTIVQYKSNIKRWVKNEDLRDVRQYIDSKIPCFNWNDERGIHKRKNNININNVFVRRTVILKKNRKTKKIIKSSYDLHSDDFSRGHRKGMNKGLCNTVFFLSIFHLYNSGNIAYLDAEEHHTTNYLRTDFDVNQLYPINNNSQIIDKIRATGIKNATCMNMKDFLEQTVKRFIAIWFDYCGAWEGNNTTGIKLRDDVKIAFDRKLLLDTSILAITVCRRGYSGTNDELIEDITDSVTMFGEKNGYNICFRNEHIYGDNKSMIFLIFVVTKIK